MVNDRLKYVLCQYIHNLFTENEAKYLGFKTACTLFSEKNE